VSYHLDRCVSLHHSYGEAAAAVGGCRARVGWGVGGGGGGGPMLGPMPTRVTVARDSVEKAQTV